MRKYKIAILGFGTVGCGAYRILEKNREYIRNTQDLDAEVVAIFDRTADKLVARGIDRSLFCPDIHSICKRSDITLVIETMGGVEPAKTFVTDILNSGKSVVTANKELLAKHWGELEDTAKRNGVGLYFEASCVGGVPIIRALNESFQGDRVQSIYGIINGTTNYILSKMSSTGSSYESALEQAQKLGFAEADPTSDVEGYDAAYKLSILASLAFHTCIPYTRVYREGISKVSAQDIINAHTLGYTVKLLAIGKRSGNDVEARVHPVFVPAEHPLASVSGAFNAVYLRGDNAGDLMFYGAGAGAAPTGSAIVSDVIKALKGEKRYCDFVNDGKLGKDIRFEDDFTSKYYICLNVDDRAGVLSGVATVFSDNGVSIKSALQHPDDDDTATLVFLTHDAKEHSVKKSLDTIGAFPTVKSINSMIRVL